MAFQTSQDYQKLIFDSGISFKARWFYIGFIFFVGLITKIIGTANVNFPFWLMLLLIIIASVYNLAGYLLAVKRKVKSAALNAVTLLQFLFDIVVLTIIIHFAGGIESISFVFYFFVIIAAGFTFRRIGVLLVSLFSVVAYSFLIYGEFFGLFAHQARYEFSDPFFASRLDVVVINTIAVSIVLLVAGFFVGFLSDLRRRHEAEVIIERTKRLAEAKKLEKDRSRLVTILSHQLRTPLNHIRVVFSEFFEEEKNFNQAQKNLLQEGWRAVQKVISLLDKLMEMTEMEKEEIKLKFDKICFNDIIANSVSSLGFLLSEKKLNIVSNHEKASKMIVKGDLAMISFVVEALIENAIDYSYKGNEVAIDLVAENGWARLAVVNTGLSIAQEEKEKIFSKFYRADKASSMRTDRSGLSLYLVKMVIEKHGGKVWFESADGNKTAFYINLPIAD